MKAILWFLLVLSSRAFGATYYVNTACPINGNGLAGGNTCAQVSGGAGPFSVASSLVWRGGDTILLRAGTVITDFPSPVLASNLTIGVYGAGNCPTIRRNGTFSLSIAAPNVKINDICISGNASSALLNVASLGFVGNRLEIYGNGSPSGIGVRFNTGSGGAMLVDSAVHDISDDGVGIGTSTVGTVTLVNLNCYRVDLAFFSGDCVQAYDGTSANLVIDGGVFVKETATKQAIVYNGSGTVTIKGAPDIDISGGSGGIQISGTATFILTSANIKASPNTAKAILISTVGPSSVSGLVVDGGLYGVWVSHTSGAVTLTNSSVANQVVGAVYHTTGGTLTVVNTYMDAPTTLFDASSTATTYAVNNRYGRASWQWNGIPVFDLSTWVTMSGQDIESTVGLCPTRMCKWRAP
jgi:hypothetical protein